MKISSILSTKPRDVIAIRPEQSLAEAVDLLAAHNIGALVVTDENGGLVGIVSERDIVRAAVRNRQVLTLSVADVMTKKVIVGMPQDDLMAVAHTMTERRIRHIPIVQESELVGMISIGDILKAQRDKFLGEIDTLEIQLLADTP